MKYRVIALILLAAAVGSSAGAMAKGPGLGGIPQTVRQAMMSGWNGHAGSMPSMSVQFHIGSRTVALGTFVAVMGANNTAAEYQLLRRDIG